MSHRPPEPKRTTSGNREKLARLFDLGLVSGRGRLGAGGPSRQKFDRGTHDTVDQSSHGGYLTTTNSVAAPLVTHHPHPPNHHHQAASKRPALRFNTSTTSVPSSSRLTLPGPFASTSRSNSTNNIPTSFQSTAKAPNLRPALKERSTTQGTIYERPYHDPRNQTSFSWRAGNMAGVFDLERQRTRRERTFIGSECAVCEEPLEHTLRGERVLQFSCGHVSHEACFYEYIREPDSQHCPTCDEPLGLDTSRGGNVLDLEKLSSIVRSAASQDYRSGHRAGPSNTGTWEDRPRSRDGQMRTQRRDYSRGYSQERQDRYDSRQHARNDSGTTGPGSLGEIPDPQTAVRRHDYDVHSMETNFSSPRTSMIKNPVPPPTVTVRSEFPTLNKSRQQQALTCLVTIEVPANDWQPDPDDVRSAPSAPGIGRSEEGLARPPSPPPTYQPFYPSESPEVLEAATETLRSRVDNWHGLDFRRFGKLRLYGNVRVGKDRQTWQELECFLFSEMLICVKEKKASGPSDWEDGETRPKSTKCTLKGSILIKKHLKQVTESAQDAHILTLSLSVAELPSFHLQFQHRRQLEEWRRALLDLNGTEVQTIKSPITEPTDNSETDDEDYRTMKTTKRVSSINSSYGGTKSVTTAPTEYTNSGKGINANSAPFPAHFHVPLDIVVVIPVSASMQGLKITLLRDALRFLVQQLGERDRMGLVTFGSGAGGVPLVGMTTRTWSGWNNVLNSVRPAERKSLRADVVEGANVAMDLLMQRKSTNPIATIFLISDSSTSDTGDVNFVVSRAEAAKVSIHSFGLGLTHKPDTMIELSTRTKASYTYVKDWMMLRECVAGCLGSMQTLSHQNAKLRMRLPEGSPARFVKINGALQTTRRAGGKDAEAMLGDLRFGDKRGMHFRPLGHLLHEDFVAVSERLIHPLDVLVQLVIAPDNSSQEHLPQDAWETIVSGLEALGGPIESEDQRTLSVEEVPLIQAEVIYGDILRQGTVTHTRPSLLAITMLPRASSKSQSIMGRPSSPPIPPHPSIVQRRMELLTSDMLSRALTLVSKGQHDRAQHLLNETRSILKGLGKGGLPPIPATQASKALGALGGVNGVVNGDGNTSTPNTTPELRRSPSPPRAEQKFVPAPGIDAATIQAIDAELENALEWIGHPAVFGRDSRKAVLQAIGVISSQRGYAFRSPAESLWAGRIPGIKRLTALSREWREADESLMEET